MSTDLDRWLAGRQAPRRAKQALIASIALTLLLYYMPLGGLVGYPLMLLSTVVHELGHGLTALALGLKFKSLVIYADGSGVAQHTVASAPWAAATVAAGGLVGPAIAAALGFSVGPNERLSRVFLGATALFLAVIMALFVRNGFGLAFTGAVAGGLGYIAVRKPHRAQLVLVFLSVQLALSVFSRGDYLFTDVAETGAGPMPSDVAHMAQALGGPYWVWGLACGAFSVAVLAGGIAWYWRALNRQG